MNQGRAAEVIRVVRVDLIGDGEILIRLGAFSEQGKQCRAAQRVPPICEELVLLFHRQAIEDSRQLRGELLAFFPRNGLLRADLVERGV